jgi:hypothetical protein
MKSERVLSNLYFAKNPIVKLLCIYPNTIR